MAERRVLLNGMRSFCRLIEQGNRIFTSIACRRNHGIKQQDLLGK